MILPLNPCKRILAVIFLVASSLLISGCWDRREIQDRSFVLASAIDMADLSAEKPSDKKQFQDLDPQIHGGKELQFSLQLLRLSPKSGGESGSQAGGGGRTYILSSSGRPLFEMIRDMSAKNSKSLWFEHMQTLFINDQVFKVYSINQIIDFFRRDAEMRWSMRIYVTSGSARSLLEFEPPTGEPGGVFFAGAARNATKNPHLPTIGVNLASVAKSLDQKADFILPRIELSGKDVKITGMAMFKKDKYVGYVNDYAVKGVKLLRGLEKSAIITTGCPDHPDEITSLELFRHDTILEPHVEGDSIYFTVNIAMRGNIGEGACANRHKPDDPEFMSRLNAAFAREVDRNIHYGAAECQRLGVDDLGFAQMLKAYKPKEWARVKDRWDEVFPTIPVYVTTRVSIMNFGEHK